MPRLVPLSHLSYLLHSYPRLDPSLVAPKNPLVAFKIQAVETISAKHRASQRRKRTRRSAPREIPMPRGATGGRACEIFLLVEVLK